LNGFGLNNSRSEITISSYLLKLFPKKIDIKFDIWLLPGRNGGTQIALAKALCCRVNEWGENLTFLKI
jgi:hypothetical protein